MELPVLSSTPPKEMSAINAPVPAVQVEEITDTICVQHSSQVTHTKLSDLDLKLTFAWSAL
jgi:hypothetical protein